MLNETGGVNAGRILNGNLYMNAKRPLWRMWHCVWPSVISSVQQEEAIGLNSMAELFFVPQELIS